MTDEEKNVIDLLKNIDKQKCLMLNCPVVKNNIERQLKIIELNRIIRKQSKEIEELSDKLTEKICKGVEEEILEEYRQTIISKDKEIEELKRVDISNSQIIANMSTRHFNDREKIRKYEKLVDKIKAKIEELEKGNKNTFIRGEKILILQSLLEKE